MYLLNERIIKIKTHMKKLILASLCLGLLASCNVKNSDEFKRLQAERDSLMSITSADKLEISEMEDIINEVEANFEKIREAEKYLAVESQTKGELTSDRKTKISENFQMVSDILAKNKLQIEKLNKQAKGNSGMSSSLQKKLTELNAELENRAKIITELQETLAQRDKQIAELTQNISGLSDNVQRLTNQTSAQAEKLKEQDRALNTAYYIFGTSKELKEAKVISGGFLSSSKVLKETIDKSIFIQIDIRDVHEIPIYSKKAKVLSDHPKDTYKLVKDADGKVSLQILDYQRFWSITQYLVVEAS